MSERIPERLPPEWLPDPVAPPGDEEDAPVWEWRLRRLVAAAEPRLARLRARETPWWSGLAAWWRPVTAAAVAAAAALILGLRLAPERLEAPPRGTLALSAVVSEGEPAALWIAVGSEADPVLALLALEGEAR